MSHDYAKLEYAIEMKEIKFQKDLENRCFRAILCGDDQVTLSVRRFNTDDKYGYDKYGTMIVRGRLAKEGYDSEVVIEMDDKECRTILKIYHQEPEKEVHAEVKVSNP